MADNYLGFTFNGETIGIIGTEDYNGFIVNSGEDLKFSSAPGFSNEFASPALGDHSIYTGTTVDSRVFNFKIALKENTYAEFQSVLKWLGTREEGYLIFDYNPDFGYMVKVNSISEATYVVQYDDKYNIEFDVEFITTGDWAAYELETSTALYTYTLGANIDTTGVTKSFIVDYTFSTGALVLTNNSQVTQYFTVYDPGNTVVITNTTADPDIIIWSNDESGNMTYYSQYGISITATGVFGDNIAIASCAIESGQSITFTSSGLTSSCILTILARQNI